MDGSYSTGIKKFDGTEWEVFGTLMEALLTAKNLKHVLNSKRPSDQAEAEKWDKDNNSAKSLLLLSLEPDVVKLVLSCTTAKDIWDRLKEVHSKNSDACQLLLMEQFFATKLRPGQKVSAYVAECELIVKRLKDIGEPISDTLFISKIVSGLGQDFRQFKSIWMSTAKSERTYANLLPKLIAEESVTENDNTSNPSAMKATVSAEAKQRDGKKDRKKKSKKEVECYNCHKKGHYSRECKSPKVERSETNEKKYAAMAKVSHNDDRSWYFDSGASFHICRYREWFKDYKEHKTPIPITGCNNEKVYAEGCGSVEVTSIARGKQFAVVLTDVQYVPNISNNLFSQGAADSKGIGFNSKHGRLNAVGQDGLVFMQGRKVAGNMYVLDIHSPARACIAKSRRTIEEWHNVLGHPSVNEIANLQKKGCTVGFEIVTQDKSVERCGACQLGKGHCASHPDSTRKRSEEVLHRIHVDTVGAIDPPSLGGSKYFVLARDEYSSYLMAHCIASKKQVFPALRKLLTDASVATQRRVQIIRSDNGTEYNNTAIKLYCDQEGIVQEFSAPYTAQQNGLAERANRTVIERARSMLQKSGLPLNLWAEAILTAVYLSNLVTNKNTPDRTPFEMFFGRPPVYSHLVEFGQEVHVHDNSKAVSKFSAKTIEAYAVGYGSRINTYRCYVPTMRDVIITSDVVPAKHSDATRADRPPASYITFLVEEEVASEPPSTNLESEAIRTPERPSFQRVAARHSEEPVAQGSIDLPVQTEEDRRRHLMPDPLDSVVPIEIESRRPTAPAASMVVEEAPRLPPRAQSQTAHNTTFVISGSSTPRTSAEPSIAQTNRPSVVRSTSSVAPANVNNSPMRNLSQLVTSNVEWVMKNREKRKTQSKYARIAKSSDQREPGDYDEAINGPLTAEWKQAIKRELDAHDKNGTWSIVPMKSDIKEISAKWVFRIKTNIDGGIDCYKARLVARGFSQVAGLDFGEIFAPVVRMESLRLLFALCAQYRLEIAQFDITTAFLYGEVKEDLYLQPPEGLEVPAGHTLKLIKSLYGLRQAPRCWNEKFTEMLHQFSMRQTSADPCVFIGGGSKDDELIILALYVDDGIIFARSKHMIDRLLKYLSKHFDIKKLDSRCFLGIELFRDDNGITLHQRTYAQRILERFGMENSRAVATPLEVGHALHKHETLAQDAVLDVPYAEAIGALQYLATGTRPDLSYTLSVLSKYTKAPRPAHWQAVKRVFRYIRGTVDQGLLYKAVSNPRIICYSDADHGGDHENRRSTTGLVSFINTGPISYKAQQQATVALSTTEAEYVAATPAVKEIVWLKRFIEELGFKVNTRGLLLCDSQSAIRLVKNPEFHQRTKHIDIRFHFIREKLQDQLFEIVYVDTDNQKADLFTKALAKDKHKRLCKALGCTASDSSEEVLE